MATNVNGELPVVGKAELGVGVSVAVAATPISAGVSVATGPIASVVLVGAGADVLVAVG